MFLESAEPRTLEKAYLAASNMLPNLDQSALPHMSGELS